MNDPGILILSFALQLTFSVFGPNHPYTYIDRPRPFR